MTINKIIKPIIIEAINNIDSSSRDDQSRDAKLIRIIFGFYNFWNLMLLPKGAETYKAHLGTLSPMLLRIEHDHEPNILSFELGIITLDFVPSYKM